MSKLKFNLLDKFLETENDLVEDIIPKKINFKDIVETIEVSRLSVSELMKYNSNKLYASQNMYEEIIRWKSQYNQEIHEGEVSNPREIRLERLMKWINPDSQLMFEFENDNSRLTFDEMEDKVFNLVKNELFGFLNFGALDTYIAIGEDVFISRYIEKDLISTRDRLLIELGFIKSSGSKYADVEYYERYSEINGKDILVLGVKLHKLKQHKSNMKSPKAIRVRSVREKTIVTF
jgi:hypothetical protein